MKKYLLVCREARFLSLFSASLALSLAIGCGDQGDGTDIIDDQGTGGVVGTGGALVTSGGTTGSTGGTLGASGGAGTGGSTDGSGGVGTGGEGTGGDGTGGDGAGGALVEVDCPATYSNPVKWEDLPDLEVIRVDDVFYYTASTFHHSPGAPILKSYDLINWEYAGHSVPVLDFAPIYSMTGGTAYVNGIWASTLRYRPSNETFYWMGCMHGGGGGVVFTAKSPEGPWEKHSGGCYYDMGLLIDDDDKMYVAYGNNDISVATLSADGFSQVGNQRVLTNTTSVAGGPLEGSRMIKRGEYYYIFMTQYAQGEWVTRSKNPTGPYETPRGFAVRTPYAGAAGSGGSPHQGGVIETKSGEWYYMGFNDSYPAGRIPVMAPMTWVDDWPVLTLVNGQWGGTYPYPDVTCYENGGVRSSQGLDTFNTAELAPEWEWNHNPDDEKWSSGDGLTLQTVNVTDDLYKARNTLTRRVAGPVSIGTIELDYSMMKDGDVAGLAAFRNVSAWIGIKKSGGATRVSMTSGINMNTSWATTSKGSEVAGAAVSGGKIWLRVEANVRSNNGGATAKFSYSTDGTQFTPLGNTLAMNKEWNFFLGYRFGIFNYATQSVGGEVKVSSFETTIE